MVFVSRRVKIWGRAGNEMLLACPGTSHSKRVWRTNTQKLELLY